MQMKHTNSICFIWHSLPHFINHDNCAVTKAYIYIMWPIKKSKLFFWFIWKQCSYVAIYTLMDKFRYDCQFYDLNVLFLSYCHFCQSEPKR